MKINVFGIRGFPDVQGGVEKHCEELYPRLASKEFQFKVFRRKPYIERNNAKKFKYIQFNDGWTIKNKYLETPIHSFLSAFKTIKDDPDIVHIHNIGPAMALPLVKLFGLKTIVTYHSSNYEHAKWNWLAKVALRASEKSVFILADKVIFVSKSKMEHSNIKKSKAIFIPNGITDFTKLKPSITLSQFNLKKNAFILAVGRITQEKRHADLIEAFSRLKTDMKLVIAGGYDNNAEYFKKISGFKKQLGDRLVFTGFIQSNDIKLLYQNAYCFCLPSENEGMPIVLLEAMSFGLCPLVSDIQENIDVLGTEGFSFRTKDASDLKKKLEFMIKNPSLLKQKGARCKKLVAGKYDWGSAAKKTMAIYEELAK